MLDATATLPLETPLNSTCQHCGSTYTPRTGSGGKPQRFCSTECRRLFHANADQRQSENVGVVPSGTLGSVVSNGHENILVPEADLKKIDAIAAALRCEQQEDEGVPFDWATGEVLIAEQPMTAVYENTRGAIVIRQPNASRGDCDDDIVLISRNNLIEFIDELCNLAGIPGAGK